MTIAIKSLDHVVLRVADTQRAIRFYCDVLGCREERRVESIGLVQLRAGGSWPWTMRGVHSLPVTAQRTLGSQELLDYVLKGCEQVWDKHNPTWPGLIATRRGKSPDFSRR